MATSAKTSTPVKTKATAPKTKTAAKKVAVPAKTTTAKTAAKKTPAKKTVAKAKTASKATKTKPSKISPHERYKMTEVAAYFLAEKNGFAGNPVEYWTKAEAQINALLK
ncbi:hypothetical protein A7981_04950 [Methylovorus sp. MM2]|uniref:DUF2934 domain-containing protein n=1 Tax=Methylovorus sp. MM2 TaxID=1848038 RepID=UPI0007E1BF17|nr:DUF2934 domain-containing protein [Methylovorus sp. MM2]OAM52792.1 hypothetical protein A7981_04950 [Methylovorus sp. MM2]